MTKKAAYAPLLHQQQAKARRQERAALALEVLALVDQGQTWRPYERVLLHCLRVGDVASLEAPQGRRRFRRALEVMHREMGKVLANITS